MIMKDVIDLGESTKFNIAEEYYKEFCNQVEKGETKSSRAVFSYDWQRFLWAFILGVSAGKRMEIKNKTRTPPFGTEVFKNRNKILKLMIGLSLQEMYQDNPDKLKSDFEEATANGENLGKKIKLAIEEFANTGFAIMHMRAQEKPGYIENVEDVVEDILSERIWAW